MTLLNSVMIYGAIILIASLAGMIADRSGDISFWINGSMIIGALLYSITGSVFKGKSSYLPLSLIISALGAGLFSMIHALATIKWKADFILSATALNILAAGLALFIVPIAASKYQNGTTIFVNPFVNEGYGRDGLTYQAIYWTIIAAVVLVVVSFYFAFTKIGLRHKSIGENPNSSDAASINVTRYKYFAILVAGSLCGMAGAMTLTKMNAFIGNVQGMGFIALAVVILGQWRITIITAASIVFALVWGYVQFDENLVAVLPKEFLKSLPFILSLGSLIFLSKFKSAPAAQGIHFIPEGGR